MYHFKFDLRDIGHQTFEKNGVIGNRKSGHLEWDKLYFSIAAWGCQVRLISVCTERHTDKSETTKNTKSVFSKYRRALLSAGMRYQHCVKLDLCSQIQNGDSQGCENH